MFIIISLYFYLCFFLVCLQNWWRMCSAPPIACSTGTEPELITAQKLNLSEKKHSEQNNCVFVRYLGYKYNKYLKQSNVQKINPVLNSLLDTNAIDMKLEFLLNIFLFSSKYILVDKSIKTKSIESV